MCTLPVDLAKFCDLLNESSLFFSRPKYFSDPWEGYLPKMHFKEDSYGDIPKDVVSLQIKFAKEILPNSVREDFAVSCWHINEYESEALWRNYSSRGIVIQTTFGKLKESFKNNFDYDIYIGKVDYKDQDIDIVDVKNMFNHILWKRKSFEYGPDPKILTPILYSLSI